MIIGNNNVFEVGSVSQSLKIGDSNILEAKSYVGRGTSLSHGCIIGAGCRLTTDEVLTENSVIYGGQCSRRAAKERPAPQHLQIDFLSKVSEDNILDLLLLLLELIIISAGPAQLSPPEEASQEAGGSSSSFLTEPAQSTNPAGPGQRQIFSALQTLDFLLCTLYYIIFPVILFTTL